jgi:hypothetical protein
MYRFVYIQPLLSKSIYFDAFQRKAKIRKPNTPKLNPELDWYVLTMEKINANRITVGHFLGNRSLRKPRRRWEDKMNTNFSEIDCSQMQMVGQDRAQWRTVVLVTLKLRVLSPDG